MLLSRKLLCLSCLLILSSTSLLSQLHCIPNQRTLSNIKVSRDRFHLYLLIGQSNMAGRGIVEPQDTLETYNILRLNRYGDWEIAKDPIHFDKSVAGVGPGLSFAKEMISDSIVIGLIPCAAGGSSLDVWLKDLYWDQTKSTPYNDAILRTKLAMKDGVLKGILWQQGESDCSPQNIESYTMRLVLFVNKLREDLKSSDVPFIAGELPEFNNNAKIFNEVLRPVESDVKNFSTVSGKDLSSNPDGIHIDAFSARILGKRYSEKMKTILQE